MENNLTCAFCEKQFVREKNYLKHKCETMKRYELFDTVDGQFAYIAFNNWRKMKKFAPVSVEIFASSRYFNSFIRFAEYSRTQSIPDRIGYIKIMTEKDLLPFFWCDYDVYDFFIKQFDESCPVDKKIEISIDTLEELAERYECSVPELFGKISAIELLKLVTARRLTPWLLLPSQKFKYFLLHLATSEERMLFNSFVDFPKWKQQFDANPELVNTIRALNTQLGI